MKNVAILTKEGKLAFVDIMELGSTEPRTNPEQVRLDKEIQRCIDYVTRNREDFTAYSGKYKVSRYHKKPNNFKKLELLLYIKYGKPVEVRM